MPAIKYHEQQSVQRTQRATMMTILHDEQSANEFSVMARINAVWLFDFLMSPLIVLNVRVRVSE